MYSSLWSFMNMVVCRMPLDANLFQISIGGVHRPYNQMLI